MRLSHKDSHKLRGVPLSLITDIVRTVTFRNRGCTDDTAVAVVNNLRISIKRQIRSHGSTTGKGEYGTPHRPGTTWLSIFVGEHPARVAEVLLHEMLHSVLGLRHGQEFDEVLWRAAHELWGVKQPTGFRWTHVYEADHELVIAMIKSGIFDHYTPAHTIDPRCADVNKKFWKKTMVTENFDQFARGDIVSFLAPTGGTRLQGEIVRINKRRFSVKVPGYRTNWLVSGSHLSKV